MSSFAPRMRALAPGRYVVAVRAVTLAGGRSKTYRTRSWFARAAAKPPREQPLHTPSPEE